MNETIKLMAKFEEEFLKEVEKKTSWGKNELRLKFLEVKGKVFAEALQNS